MILSFHMTSPSDALGLLRQKPTSETPGLHWRQRALAVPLAAGLPRPTGAAIVAAWADDHALDRALDHDPRLLGAGTVRLEPVRAVGAWPALEGLGTPERPVGDDEPVAVLTLGHLRYRRAPAFLRASRPAEREAARHPALLWSTALAAPPALVATFSLWRSVTEMRAYAVGAGTHPDALRTNAAHPFHRHSLFARFHPYAATGTLLAPAPPVRQR